MANPFPVPEPAAALVGEDIPWQIYNLSIFSFPTNTTKLNRTQHIRFDAVDINPDLEFDTTCERWAAAGQPFFGDGYTACEFEMAGFSIRPDGMLWLRRKYTNRFVLQLMNCTRVYSSDIASHGRTTSPHALAILI